jgi:hypothetical protein
VTTLEQYSQLVADIYDAALDPSLWEQALKRVFSTTGGSAGALLIVDHQRRHGRNIIAANFDTEQSRKYDGHYGRLDPVAPYLAQAPVGAIVTARALTTERQRCGEFYNDWAHPNEIGDAVFVNLLDGADGVCLPSAIRGVQMRTQLPRCCGSWGCWCRISSGPSKPNCGSVLLARSAMVPSIWSNIGVMAACWLLSQGRSFTQM